MSEVGTNRPIPSEGVLLAAANENVAVLQIFPNWSRGLIRNDIPSQLAGCERIGTIFFVQPGDPQYTPLRELLTRTLESLPLNNEIGETKFLGPRSQEALRDIVEVLRGRKTWEEIEWVFTQRGSMELFKNEVYTRHSIPQAMCYNIDLGYKPNSAKNPHRVVIERINVVNTRGRIAIQQDGKFTIKDREVEVDAAGASLNVHDN